MLQSSTTSPMPPTRSSPTRSRTAAAVLAVVLVVALLGCSSEESASDRVCDARADLSRSLSAAVDDVKAGNLGDARDSVAEARTAFDDLTEAAGDLRGDTAEAVQPEVDQLRTSVGQLTDVTSLQQLSGQVQSILDDVGDVLGKISDSLDCS